MTDTADRPVVQLEPVALPPPGTSSAKSPSLSFRAGLSVAMLVGIFVVALLLILAGIGLNVVVFRLGRINVGLVLATLAVVVALGRAVWAAVKAPPEPLDEVEVSPEAEPVLHGEIARLADQVGTRPPDRIVLIPNVNAYVREFGPLLGLVGGTRTLAIGTPLLDTLTVSQLRAVLAHELGHLAGGDTRLGPLSYRTQQVLGNVVGRLGGSLSGRAFAAYWKLQYRVSAKVRRGQELVADRAAVSVAGRQAAADALRVVQVTAIGQDLFHQAYLGPLLEAGHRPTDLRDGLRQALCGRWSVLTGYLDLPVSDADPYASHPPTPERVHRLAELPETHAGGTDDRAARSLLHDPGRWITAVDEQWLRLMTDGADLPQASWSDWPRLVVAEARSAQAAVVDTVLTGLGLASGLPGVQTAFEQGRERELAAGLVRAGWRTGGADERTAVLHAAIESTAAMAAIQHAGFEWQHSWTGPAALRSPAGETVEWSEPARHAVEGDWEPLQAQLRSIVAVPAAGPVESEVRGADPSDATATARADPPQPLFRPIGDGAWQAELPGSVGRKAKVRVDDHAVTLNGKRCAYDDIEHLKVALNDGTSGLSATVALTTSSGESIKARMASATAKGREPTLQAVDFIWRSVRAVAGPRLSADLANQIARGEEVTIGGVVLDRHGARSAKKRKSAVLPWSSVADPQVNGRSVVIPGFDVDGIVVPLDERDTFLLFEAIPELRARFAD